MPVKPITPCPAQGVIRGASELKDYFDAFVKPNLPGELSAWIRAASAELA
jgi:hypothetical protein